MTTTYKFLGWLNDGQVQKTEEYKNCQKLDHDRNQVDNNETCDHTISCDVCRIFWKYDSSD